MLAAFVHEVSGSLRWRAKKLEHPVLAACYEAAARGIAFSGDSHEDARDVGIPGRAQDAAQQFASTAATAETAGAGGEAPLACDTSWDTYPSKGDGAALTPPMGWNSWNVFHENINERQIREIADAMVSSGMRDAGFVYVNLDDKWMDDDGRDSTGNLVADDGRFPSGIAALADYMHERGLKLGVYGDRGTETCANRGTTHSRDSCRH